MVTQHLAVLPEAVVLDVKMLVLDAPVAPQQPQGPLRLQFPQTAHPVLNAMGVPPLFEMLCLPAQESEFPGQSLHPIHNPTSTPTSFTTYTNFEKAPRCIAAQPTAAACVPVAHGCCADYL